MLKKLDMQSEGVGELDNPASGSVSLYQWVSVCRTQPPSSAASATPQS